MRGFQLPRFVFSGTRTYTKVLIRIDKMEEQTTVTLNLTHI